jgi:Pentapeptide repeats (8 copies)
MRGSNTDYALRVLREVTVAIAPLLTGPRPKGQVVDLRSAWFNGGDWHGVDLSGADIENIDLRNTDLAGADLGEIRSFSRAYLWRTNWWDAKRISPELLEYLVSRAPLDENGRYGKNFVQVSQHDYEDAISRLKSGK